MKTTIDEVWHPGAISDGSLALLKTRDNEGNRYTLHVFFDRKKHATGKKIDIEFVGRRQQ